MGSQVIGEDRADSLGEELLGKVGEEEDEEEEPATKRRRDIQI